MFSLSKFFIHEYTVSTLLSPEEVIDIIDANTESPGFFGGSFLWKRKRRFRSETFGEYFYLRSWPFSNSYTLAGRMHVSIHKEKSTTLLKVRHFKFSYWAFYFSFFAVIPIALQAYLLFGNAVFPSERPLYAKIIMHFFPLGMLLIIYFGTIPSWKEDCKAMDDFLLNVTDGTIIDK